MKASKTGRRYDAAFKQQAVELLLSSGKLAIVIAKMGDKGN